MILLGSILSLALLAAIGHYLFWAISFSTASGRVSPGAISPVEKVASVSEKPAAEEPKPISPPPPRKEAGEGPPAVSPSPPVSSEPPSSASVPPSAPTAAPEKVPKAEAKEADKSKTIQEIPKKTDARKAEIAPKKDFFAIKIMALADPKRTQEFLEQQKQRDFDVHIRPVSTQNKGVLQQIFLGHFKNQEEALRFMKEKKIRQTYPGSVIMKLSP
jgi:hypothetical protein